MLIWTLRVLFLFYEPVRCGPLSLNTVVSDFGPMTDEERLVKVKDYLALSDAKKEVVDSYEYTGAEKIQKCHQLSDVSVHLGFDGGGGGGVCWLSVSQGLPGVERRKEGSG